VHHFPVFYLINKLAVSQDSPFSLPISVVGSFLLLRNCSYDVLLIALLHRYVESQLRCNSSCFFLQIEVTRPPCCIRFFLASYHSGDALHEGSFAPEHQGPPFRVSFRTIICSAGAQQPLSWGFRCWHCISASIAFTFDAPPKWRRHKQATDPLCAISCSAAPRVSAPLPGFQTHGRRGTQSRRPLRSSPQGDSQVLQLIRTLRSAAATVPLPPCAFSILHQLLRLWVLSDHFFGTLLTPMIPFPIYRFRPRHVPSSPLHLFLAPVSQLNNS